MKNFEREKDIVKDLSLMPRHLVGLGIAEAYDILEDFAKEKNLQVERQKFASGTEHGSWKIPNQWSPVSAIIKTVDGEIIFEADSTTLGIVSYSLPFKGFVTYGQLIEHLYVSEHVPQAIPFIFKYYKREWGLAVTQNFLNSLKDDKYYVEIEINEHPGELEVLEITKPGHSEDVFMLCSHICHPFQINDGPIAAPFLIRILSELCTTPNFTYKILLVPELIGSAVWLHNNLHSVTKIKAGLFVEMIGTDLHQRLHKSFDGLTKFDEFVEQTLSRTDPNLIVDEFCYCNDERNFNGPGVGIPFCGLTRSHMSRHMPIDYAFEHYHTSYDNFENINWANLMKSYVCIEDLINKYDRLMCKPVNNFIGEPFLTKFGLHVDIFAKGSRLTEKIAESNLLMDHIFMTGKGLTINEIAIKLRVEPEVSAEIYRKLVESKLVYYA